MAIVFDNDEQGYHDWLNNNPNGYVLNLNRQRTKLYGLHRTTCNTITNHRNPGAFTTRQYIKVCGDTINDIDNWRNNNNFVPNAYSRCGFCNP